MDLPSKAPLPNTVTLGIESSTYEFGVDANIQTIVLASSDLGWCVLNVVQIRSDRICSQIRNKLSMLMGRCLWEKEGRNSFHKHAAYLITG